MSTAPRTMPAMSFGSTPASCNRTRAPTSERCTVYFRRVALLMRSRIDGHRLGAKTTWTDVAGTSPPPAYDLNQHKTIIQDAWVASARVVRRSLVVQRVEVECVHDAQRVRAAELQHTLPHGIARLGLLSRPRAANTTIEVTQNECGPSRLMEMASQKGPEAKNVSLLCAESRPVNTNNGPPPFLAGKLQRARHHPTA